MRNGLPLLVALLFPTLLFPTLLFPTGALAHGVSPAISGFYAGGMMVLIGPEELLQWVALGAVAAVHPPRQAGWVAEALAAGLLVGFGAGALGWGGFLPLWDGAAGLLIVGTMLVVRVCVPFLALMGLALCIGLVHGAHAGSDMIGRTDRLAIAAGVGIAAYGLMVICIATMAWLQRQTALVPIVAFRAFGSWVVAIALLLGVSELVKL